MELRGDKGRDASLSKTFCDVLSLMCRRGHTDCRPAGSSGESSDTAAWDPFDSFKRAGPDSPSAWHLHHYTAERAESHIHHPDHAGQICAYSSTLLSFYLHLCPVWQFLFSPSCFSTSSCVPASTFHYLHALKSWWVRGINLCCKSSTIFDVMQI